MSKITYATKSGDIPKQTHYKEWWDDDANEVKTVVNNNDDELQAISKSGLLTVTVKLDLISGHFVNSAGSPITTTIPIDLTDGIQGGDALVWYKGPLIDVTTVTGATTLFTIGSNEVNKLCIVVIVYDKRSGGVILNIAKGVEGSIPVGPSATPPTITVTEVPLTPSATAPIITVTE